MNYILISLLWLAGAASAVAQTPAHLVPAAQLFNQRYFRPRNVFVKLTWLDKNAQVQKERVLNLVTRVDSANHRLTFLQLRNDGKRDSSVAELPTLRPVYVGSVGAGQKVAFDYRGGLAIKVLLERNGKIELNEGFTMPQPYFDGYLSEYLLGALPLRPGYTAEFESYSAELRRNSVTRIKRVTADALAGPGGQFVRAHHVTLAANGLEAEYWLDATTGEFLRSVFAQPDGSLFIKTKI
ncbi:DUF3108 domain-containing protein [Hymenobacter terrenus]|uniref:DUF3108 domain-containing protein n=1 Tax=Hymenobacter terrenus TaxID=1629124 RepID=UPI000619224A|nr:hypothetical protein [Hymenobacter terrenus]